MLCFLFLCAALRFIYILYVYILIPYLFVVGKRPFCRHNNTAHQTSLERHHHGIMMTMTTTTMRLARRRRRDVAAALVEGQVWGAPKGGGKEEDITEAKTLGKRYSRKAQFFQSATTPARRDQRRQNDEGNTRGRSNEDADNKSPAGGGCFPAQERLREKM